MQDADSETASLPLSDIRVLELGHIVAGPFCSLMLADLGAEVIKIENKASGGDAIRNSSDLGNSTFDAINRNKKSVTLNLKSETGRNIFYELIEDTDVVIENFAPGVTERLGIDYETLQDLTDGLVYCSIKGFAEGPYKEFPALDPIAEALSGLMSVTGIQGEKPARVGTSISDMAASLFGVISILTALRQRDQTGNGQHLTAPMFESTVSLMSYWLAYSQTYNVTPEPMGASHLNWSPYDAYRTADQKWVFIGPASEQHWQSLCSALDLEIENETRFDSVDKRREHRSDVDAIVQQRVEQIEREDVVLVLQDAGVPVAPISTVPDVVDDEHLNVTGAFGEISTTEGAESEIKVPKFPTQSSAYSNPEPEDPPSLGEHTEEVLENLGYSPSKVAALREQDCI